MMIDEEILGYYIDCHGNWPQSFVWVFMMLFQQTMEQQAEALMEEWFGSDDQSKEAGKFLRQLRKISRSKSPMVHPSLCDPTMEPVSIYCDEGQLDFGL